MNLQKKLYFIVGTDTEIGKTYSTTKYIKKILHNNYLDDNLTVLKPIETGKNIFPESLKGSDTYNYSKLLNKDIKDINLYFFSEPMSPHIAAEIDGAEISIKKVKKFIDNNLNKYKHTFVEGAGGLIVPFKLKKSEPIDLDLKKGITDISNRNINYTYLDLIAEYKEVASVILISPNKLGTINSTLLTIEALKSKGISIKGIIFNDIDKNTSDNIKNNNIDTILSFHDLEILDIFKYE